MSASTKSNALFERRQATTHIPIFGSDEVADVTGAGDTVLATFGLALASGASFYEAARLANYIVALRKDVLALSRACGVPHPALITADQLELLDDRFGARTVAELFGYGRGFGVPSAHDCEEVRRLMKV